MMKSLICTSLAAGVLLAASPASAQMVSPKPASPKPVAVLNPEVSARAVLASNGDVTPVFGAALVAYRLGSVYMGGAGYGGARYGQLKGGMGYGGAIVGAASDFGGPLLVDARILVGGGGGAVGGNGMGSLALEPSLAIGVALPNDATVSLTGGYLYMPNASEMSGLTAGLRYAF